jgi:3-oxoadipate enol-lactonase/4-carboxymuconolactone decarboxylase
MAFIQLDAIRCYYRLEGAHDRPALVLSHSLGLDHSMWDPQVPELTSRFRVLRYDLRGHGASDAPKGEYTVEALGRDALALLDRLHLERVAWCGCSLGGMVGQWLAVHAPDRLSHLVLANTSPRVADPAGIETRRKTVLERGMSAIAETALTRFFGPALVAANPALATTARETLLATNTAGYAGCCAALRDFDGTPALSRIRTPTLVISGDQDEAMPWDDHGGRLHRDIAGATAVRLPTAHLSNLALPHTFTRRVFESLSPAARDPLAAGMTVRRAILGDAYVDRAIASTTELTRDFQELITRVAWGAVWMRPGLDARTRRLLVLASTVALGRWEEFRLHLAAGVDHDVEWSDVEEVLLQSAVYAGIPAANAAFKIAAEEDLARRRRVEDGSPV